MTTDFLVIGSGIAGLTFVIKVAEAFPEKTITIVTKASTDESNTKYAQGGIAIVQKDSDSFKKHIEDTLKAGDGLCDISVVKTTVEEGTKVLDDLQKLGVNFDTTSDGNLDLGKEGGHSEHRILHHKDITGKEIERALINRVKTLKNIVLLNYHFAIDLISEHHTEKKQNKPSTTCFGAYILNQKTGKIETCVAKITLLATGGIGQVYGHTTNPAVATGDGIAMAYRMGAKISDMEFIQFHPTALYQLEKTSSFLISEAVRGAGAVLKNKRGEAFMSKYDSRGDLASRDIVSRSIDVEMKKSGDNHVYLDCTHLNQKEFQAHFPHITNYCKSIGIDVAHNMIPVLPAQHYLCGGIDTNLWGQTTINHLFACGECARTGLHGANRLASNSLLEAFVFASRAAKKSIEMIENIHINDAVPDWNSDGTTHPDELILITQNKKELQETMQHYVGIVRSNVRLKRALSRLKLLYEETEALYKTTTLSPQLCELRNLISVGNLIVEQSQKRKENKGGFFNIDLQKH
ncbi:MAG: L-aspartate oxidase [Bacteroidia bacterium]